MDLLSELNSPQRDAVESIDGPLLIVAGPGSGKTKVITSRIAYLVKTCGVSPHRIAALTFTNKAAKEMMSRLLPMLGRESERISASTFHSFCATILRRSGEIIGLPNDFIIFDDDDQINTIKRAMVETEIDPKRFSPRAILSSISNAKSQLIGIEGLNSKKNNYYEEIVVRVFERYEEILSRSSATDFDDLLLKTHSLFENHPEVLKRYQERFVYLMVDEFQDTNVAQYEIAKQISRNHKNICVVGDPDQSIYSWRNADIRNILSFQQDFPGSKTVSLEENYRSTQTILDGAKNLISSNKERVDKDLWTRNHKGAPIIVMEGYNEEEEAQLVIREIGKLTDTKDSGLGDISVMYRVNAQSRAFEMACQRYGVPYQVVGGVKFYQRKEIKDLTAYLRLILNPNDDVSLSRVLNVPPRGIGQRTVDQLNRVSRNLNTSMYSAIEKVTSKENSGDLSTQLSPRAVRALSHFQDLILDLQNRSKQSQLVELIEDVMSSSGYSKYLDADEQSEERIENIQEYKNSAREYSNHDGQDALVFFMESVALVSDIDTIDEDKESLTLITLHQAKGLEFPVVFIAGMEEGMLPHIRSIETGTPTEMEEERRLFYVGMTRAKERLYLMRAFRRGFRGGSGPTAPSRFLSEIPDELIQIPKYENETRSDDAPNSSLGNLSRQKKKRLSSNFKPTIRDHKPYEEKSRPGKISRSSRRRVVNKIIVQEPGPIFATGDKVEHPIFGEGIVLNCINSGDDLQVTVAFKQATGVKKLMARIAKLKKIDS